GLDPGVVACGGLVQRCQRRFFGGVCGEGRHFDDGGAVAVRVADADARYRLVEELDVELLEDVRGKAQFGRLDEEEGQRDLHLLGVDGEFGARRAVRCVRRTGLRGRFGVDDSVRFLRRRLRV